MYYRTCQVTGSLSFKSCLRLSNDTTNMKEKEFDKITKS